MCSVKEQQGVNPCIHTLPVKEIVFLAKLLGDFIMHDVCYLRQDDVQALQMTIDP